MKVSLVNDALLMAIKRRNPSKWLIWHTDRGSQYASYEHKDLLKKYGIIQSMSRKGDCWDNAVSESFFHSLKTELIYHEDFLVLALSLRKQKLKLMRWYLNILKYFIIGKDYIHIIIICHLLSLKKKCYRKKRLLRL